VELPLLASGADADVFVMDDERVLRRSRNPRADSAREATLMQHAGNAGYPVPHVYAVSGPTLVLTRIYGPTMLDALLDGRADPYESGGMLVALLDRLHAIPPPKGTPEGSTLVHLDLHPLNVLLSPGGPVVIDWVNARLDDPAFDVAVSALIIAVAAAQPGDRAEAAGLLLKGFVAEAGLPGPRPLTRAVAFRTADRNFTEAERAAMPAAVDLLSR
jgi:aminoglycoside phosphotransferase (APT) family kinase protein